MNLSLTTARTDSEARRIKIHTADDFEGMRTAGRFAAELLDFITPYVVPGVTTERLDQLCHDYTVQHGAIPAPLNYRGFPKSMHLDQPRRLSRHPRRPQAD